MWYQVVQPSVQNKVIALIVPLLQFDICFLFQISSRVCEKCCQIFWISEGHLQTFQIIQRITQRYFQVTQKNRYAQKRDCEAALTSEISIQMREIVFRNGEQRDSCGSLQSMLAVTPCYPHDGASVRSGIVLGSPNYPKYSWLYLLKADFTS